MKILLAEDERELSRALEAVLKLNHYSVDSVYDGEDALCYLENGEYDGVIMDIMMPKMDGLTVLKRIRKQGNSVPVLILTAKAELDDKIEGLDCGADDYLTKPFATKELLARIRAMMRRREATISTNLIFEDLQMSDVSFKIGCNGRQLYLANKEYQMMEMFMMNPRCILSTDQFIESIWGYESDVDNSVIWTYISKLRGILRKLNSCVVIRTVKGVGFVLEGKNG
ncbi:MAG: response regulator transcription factor [Eubacteriales bacterium]|nr:response regulator transcription factor [Eubacteriales bacterium]